MNIRTFLTAIALTLVGGITMHAQGFQQIYPAWEVNALYGYLHWDSDTVFACGNEWTLLRSNDAGKTWEEMFSQTNGLHIRHLQTDGNEIFMHAYLDGIEQIDAGYFHIYAFNPYTKGVRELLLPRGREPRYPDDNFYIQYVDSTLFVLEADDDSSVLHSTTDGGANWTAVQLPETIWISVANGTHAKNAFCFTSRNIGIIVADTANSTQSRFIFRTTDAGASWHKLPGTFQSNSVFVSLVENNNAIITFFAIGNQVFKSLDSCASWTDIGPIPWNSIIRSQIAAASFLSSEEGFVAGTESDVYGTTDGGAAWVQLKESDLNNGYYTSAAVSLPGSVYLVGNEMGHMFRSENGGIIWNEIRKPEVRLGNLYFTDAFNGVAIGTSNYKDLYSFVTSDGGVTWRQELYLTTIFGGDSIQIGTQQSALNGRDTLQFFHNGIAASGIKRTIHRLTDQGKNIELIMEWSPGNAPQGIYSAFRTLHFIKSDEGTLYSYDDGTTWAFSPYDDSMNGKSEIQFVQTDNGALIAYCPSRKDLVAKPAVFYSIDSCKTWMKKSSIVDRDDRINEMDVLGFDDIIVRLTGGYLYRTTNGGDGWTLLPEIDNRGLETVYFPSVAYRFESPSLRVVKTNDLWQTKQRIMTHRGGMNTSQISFFLDTENWWIVYGYTIYRTSTGGVDWVEQPFAVREDAAITSIYPNPVAPGQQVSIDVSVGTQPFEAQGGRAVSLPRATPLRVTVYDLLGRAVATLYNGPADPGTRTLTWQPAATLPAGMYVVRMALGEKVWAKQVAFVK